MRPEYKLGYIGPLPWAKQKDRSEILKVAHEVMNDDQAPVWLRYKAARTVWGAERKKSDHKRMIEFMMALDNDLEGL